MSLQGSQMETDDPTTSYMLQVCCHHLIRTENIIILSKYHYFCNKYYCYFHFYDTCSIML